jgi:hypothetical protein
MFIGLAISGSAAKSWISKPSGNRKDLASADGASGSVERTYSAKGSLVWAAEAISAVASHQLEQRVTENMRPFIAETGNRGNSKLSYREIRQIRDDGVLPIKPPASGRVAQID